MFHFLLLLPWRRGHLVATDLSNTQECPRLSTCTIRPCSSLLCIISAHTVAANSLGALFIGLIVASGWDCPRILGFEYSLSWPFAGYMEVLTLLLNDIDIFSDRLSSVSIVQAWYYYTHQSDTWALKTLVLLVVFFRYTGLQSNQKLSGWYGHDFRYDSSSLGDPRWWSSLYRILEFWPWWSPW